MGNWVVALLGGFVGTGIEMICPLGVFSNMSMVVAPTSACTLAEIAKKNRIPIMAFLILLHLKYLIVFSKIPAVMPGL